MTVAEQNAVMSGAQGIAYAAFARSFEPQCTGSPSLIYYKLGPSKKAPVLYHRRDLDFWTARHVVDTDERK